MAIGEETGRLPHAGPGSAAPAGTGRPGQHHPKQGGLCDRHHQKGRGGYLCDPFFAGRACAPVWATAHITEEQLDALEENVYLSEFHASKGTCPEADGAGRSVSTISYTKHADSKMLEHQLRGFP